MGILNNIECSFCCKKNLSIELFTKEIMKLRKSLVPVFLLSFYLTGICLDINPAHAGINQWTAIGPEGANVLALGIDPQNPETIYAETGRHI